MPARIRRDDEVIVIAGKDRGKSGRVLRVDPAKEKVFVEGLNIVKRHQRQTGAQQGGIISKELPVHLSNLAIADPRDGKPTRVGFKIVEGGRKVRIAKRSGVEIDG